MKRTFTYLFITLLTIFPLACGDKIEPGTSKKEPQFVRGLFVATAETKEQPVIYEAVGTVKAGISSTLSSKLTGSIEDIRVREGDLVKKGDALIIMDQRHVKADVRKVQAGLSEAKKALTAAKSARDAARAEKGLARTTYERYLNLKKKRLVSVQAFDEMEAGYHQAKAALKKSEAMVEAASARVNQAEAALASVRITRKDAVINAPHDGVITAKLVDKGDLATPGSPLLSLETTRGFCVDVLLPETKIEFVEPMQKVTVKVPALSTGPLEGNVCTIVPSADPRSRSFTVKINLPIDRKVKSGLFARVEIPTGQSRKILIPHKAVITRGQLTGLYLVDAKKTARFRLIRLGKRFADAAEVLSGLREGDRYVMEPTPELKDGARLEDIP